MNANAIQLNEPIGSGSYGTIYECCDKTIACKIMESNSSHSLREIAAISLLKSSPYVVPIIDVKITEDQVCMYIPRYTSDLYTYIASKQFRLDIVPYIMFQILHAMHDAHGMGVFHRDLKSHNILINKDHTTVVCDWGMSRFVSARDVQCFTGEVQTIWYKSPEVILGERRYESAIDMWSVGVIMCDLLSSGTYDALRGDCDIDQLYRIFQLCGTPTEQTWPEVVMLPHFKTTFPQWTPATFDIPCTPDAMDLLQKLLTLDPAKRIDATAALNHPYFDKYRAAPIPQYNIKDNLTRIVEPIDIDYMQRQPDINEKMRLILVDWMVQVCDHFHLEPSTYFLSVYYIDLFLTRTEVTRAHLQLVGCACLLLASEINEVVPLELSSIVEISDCNFTESNLFDTQIRVVKSLNNNLYRPTEYTYLTDPAHLPNLYLASYALQMRVYPPHVLAAFVECKDFTIPNYEDAAHYITKHNLFELH